MLVQRTAGEVGESFLRALVREYAALSGARLVYVADHHGEHAHVLAEWRDGAESAGGEFVLPGRSPLGPASVSVPLRDADGVVFGHVGVEGVADVPTTRDVALFTLLSMRTAGEVQRHRYVESLRAGEERLAVARARLVHAVDEERRRIGRDIHDGVQQRTVAVIHLLTLAERQLDESPEAARPLLRRARDEAREATAELRDLSHGLHPVGPGRQGPGHRAGDPGGALARPAPRRRAARAPPPGADRGHGVLPRQRGGQQRRQARRGDGAARRRRAGPRRDPRDGVRRRPGRRRSAPRLGPARPAGPDRDAGRHPGRRQPARPGDAAHRLDPAGTVAHRA